MWTDPVVDEIHKIRENQAAGGRVIVGAVRRRVVAATAVESTDQS